ncbi:MAG: peptidase M28, partial [Candidatus Krumholzibacteria bacterium]|nr:peptidase M28 [Candidatus Krumholzibacteria bacterium]
MWEQIAANKRKSVVLVFFTAVLLVALGWFGGEYFWGRGGGPTGVIIAVVVWFVMTLTAWFQGDHVMLAVSGARKIEKKDLP